MPSKISIVSTFCSLTLTPVLASSDSEATCSIELPATCNAVECKKTYCLGPKNILANAPVGPTTCDGDFTVTLAGTCWRATQDGLEYAVDNDIIGTDSVTGNRELSNLITARYLTPHFKWDFGFKLGLDYVSPCDGWDVNLLWTHLNEGVKSHEEAEFSDNRTLLPLWSEFQFPNAGNAPNLFSTDILTLWRPDLNFVNLELGRQFWVSRHTSFRPHIGLRYANLDQIFHIQHKGGSWNDPGLDLRFNDHILLQSEYRGLGLRAGFDTAWNFGCGWGIYGNVAFGLLYGRFCLEHDEWLRAANSPFQKVKILETTERFKASRALFDLAIGLKWETMFCDCQYGFNISLGWEEHLFFNQNQFWRVNRLGGTNGSGILNNSGENVLDQRRGDLSAKGWTLALSFVF